MTSLAGTGELVRLILRRDRIVLLLWIVLLPLLVAGQLAGTIELYPTAEALRGYARASNNNPVTLGLLGPVYASSLGGIIAWRVGVSGMLFAGAPSLLLLIRHTRAEEESGRRELLGSTAAGRNASLTAALVVICGANLVLAAAVAAVLLAFGLPAAGSLALGLSFAAAGWVFAAVAAVVAQLTESAGAARAISLLIFVALLLLRVVADAGGVHSPLSGLSWASPLGWTRLTRPFADERWWVFALLLALSVVLTAVAYAISARRDLGAGLLSARPGRAAAAPGLRSPFALGWRLQRGMLLAWIAGFALLGGLLGAVSRSVSGLLDTAQLGDFLVWIGAGTAGEAFLDFVLYVLCQISSAYVIMVVSRLRSEEVSGRAEAVLTTAVGRLRWACSHLFFAGAGPVLVLGALGVGAGLTYGLASGDVGGELPRILGSTLAKLPAVWVVAGIAAAAYGLLPRSAVALSWGALGLCYLLELGWEVQQIGDSIFQVSPFAHLHPSAGEVDGVTLASLVGIAAALTIAAMLGLRRRDIA